MLLDSFLTSIFFSALSISSFKDKILFENVVDAGNTYWETRDKNAKGSGYKPFKRWEAYWQNYVDESGYLPSGQQLWNTWLEKTNSRQMRISTQSTTDESNWISVGPTDFLNRSTSYLNLGRVNCITPHPTNSNILYVGTPSGGIWKSIDGGLTYVALSDMLPQIGVSSIAIDHSNPDIVYIATGDELFKKMRTKKISIFDRGFLFADGVYEVTSVLGGKLIDFHLT